MYQLIIFDWDGTLMDSAQKIANCIIASARELGVDEPSDQEAKSIIGLSLGNAMNVLFPQLTVRQINKLIQVYKHHFVTLDQTEQSLFAGVEEGLVKLNELGVLLAVATGKSRVGLNRVFDELSMRQYFVASRCADETRSKPNPQMLLELLDFTAVHPDKCIMIGDTTFDMDMAMNANVHGLGAGYGVHSEDALLNSNALEVLNSFQGIIDWLLSNRLERAYS